ncbi:hypothetical protein J437_LFUL008462 [Ladona fulva]|uniref:Uncharacterized protein n=1 Tax=Ladona fulva TaxID=123851 RepID=A0A8K0K991_LADFU|nr:hypothetical protein J437_LFUL008462 [Ladona fulva]
MNATDTTQLGIFIRGIDNEFNITEQLASLVPLKGIKATLAMFSLTIDSMSGVVTVGAPAMVEKKEGLTTVIENDGEFVCNDFKNGKYVYFESLHQNDKFYKINYRQFQELLNTWETSYEDIFYFTAARWLSRGKMHKRFYDLRNEIKCFMDLKGKIVLKFESENWMADLAFLVDTTAHLNKLNMRFQGENQLIIDIFQAMAAFEIRKIVAISN